MKESDLQKSTKEFLDWACKPGVIYFHVPNEREKESARMRLAAEGVRPGVADWVFLVPWHFNETFHIHNEVINERSTIGRAYCIEMKTEKGRQSDDQKRFEEGCHSASVPYAICRSLDEFAAQLKEWGLLRPGIHL